MSGYEGYQKVKESFEATGVLNDRYQRLILGWMQMALSEAFQAGAKEWKEKAMASQEKNGELAAQVESLRSDIDTATMRANMAEEIAGEAQALLRDIYDIAIDHEVPHSSAKVIPRGLWEAAKPHAEIVRRHEKERNDSPT